MTAYELIINKKKERLGGERKTIRGAKVIGRRVEEIKPSCRGRRIEGGSKIV
jgi:hypothetical protein